MRDHVAISPTGVADRLSIQELVAAYAHCADRRDAKGQMSLFTPVAHFVIYMDAKDPRPSQELHARDALAPVTGEPGHVRVGSDSAIRASTALVGFTSDSRHFRSSPVRLECANS